MRFENVLQGDLSAAGSNRTHSFKRAAEGECRSNRCAGVSLVGLEQQGAEMLNFVCDLFK